MNVKIHEKGQLSIRVDNRVSVSEEIIKSVKKALRAGTARLIPDVKAEVELIFTDAQEIKALNAESRGKDAVTDVLSFPELELTPGVSPADVAVPSDYWKGKLFLGSIVICDSKAKEQAKEYGHEEDREFAFLAVHSLLHLLGWDHERSSEEEKEQFALQEKILISAGFKRSEKTENRTARFDTVCGNIAIVGRPNSGKSTLLNRLIGEKVSIVTPKPQTTRTRITGVLTRDKAQFIFLDTPGLHQPSSRLGDMMVKSVFTASDDADAAVLVAEADKRPGKPERQLAERLLSTGIPVIVALNKTDKVKKDAILDIIARYADLGAFAAIIPISARTGDGCDTLLAEIAKLLPENEFVYPEDALTDLPEKFLAAEMVREKLMMKLEKEIPHGITCETERFQIREDGMIEIDVLVICEKPNHKSIVIGHQGSLLKAAGSEARVEIEKLLDAKVFLKLWVKVKSDWKNSPTFLAELAKSEGTFNV